ncbi:hypothetical protein OAQ99_05185 [Candidatus Kapabacteria bacterium]|nr:hypothetical protein [Candidatus Kapabacteria bacterium]
MKFKVSISELKSTLSKVLPAIPPKSTLPVLEQIFVKIDSGIMFAISTDQDITIQSKLEVDATEDINFLVPARQLNDNLKYISSDIIEFDINQDNFEILGKTSDKSFKMKGLNPDEYPDLPELSQQPTGDDYTPCTIPKKRY